MRFPTVDSKGRFTSVDLSNEVAANATERGLDALIAIGGDGSMAIAHALCNKGLPIVGVLKTVDYDLYGTVGTFGFNSSVSFASQCIDRLHSTAEAHRRVMVVEVMDPLPAG